MTEKDLKEAIQRDSEDYLKRGCPKSSKVEKWSASNCRKIELNPAVFAKGTIPNKNRITATTTVRHSASSALVSAVPTSLTFLFSTPPLRLSLCPLHYLSFYLSLSGRSGRNCLFFYPLLSGYNGLSETYFSGRTTRIMSWLSG